MTAREISRDEQVSIARKYQISVIRSMVALEEELIKGTFSGDIHKAMHQFRLCINDAVHDVTLATLTTAEEEESIAALEAACASKDAHKVHISILKKKGAVQ